MARAQQQTRPVYAWIAGLISTLVLVGPCKGQPTQASEVTRLPEGKLAAIDSGTRSVSGAMVRPYTVSLDSLQLRCTETRERIGDFAFTGANLLRSQKSVHVSILRFLQMMEGSIPRVSSTERVKCAEIAAALVALTNRR